MQNIFETVGHRQIQYASFSYFEAPMQHPDRILAEHDLVYMLEGDWVVGQDGESFRLEPHDLIILQAGRHHYGVEACRARTRTMYVHMSALAGERVETRPTGRGLVGDSTLVGLPMVIPCKSHPRVRELFTEIVQGFWSDVPGKHIKLSALTQMLIFEAAIAEAAPLRMRDSLVASTLTTIQGSAEHVFTLAELSALVNVSSRTLSERFKKATGQTIHQYQVDLKLNMARLAIEKEPARSFKQLAAGLGFYDEFHFSKLFKKKYGLPPSKCR
ncbi:MAG: helix-turn-helix transcriptional regulator [Pseudomonadota bacterium]